MTQRSKFGTAPDLRSGLYFTLAGYLLKTRSRDYELYGESRMTENAKVCQIYIPVDPEKP